MIRRVARCDGRMVCYPNRGVATQIGSTGRCRERLWRQRRRDRPRFRANLRLHSGECHVVTGWSSSGRSGARGRSRPGSSAVAHWSGRGGDGRVLHAADRYKPGFGMRSGVDTVTGRSGPQDPCKVGMEALPGSDYNRSEYAIPFRIQSILGKKERRASVLRAFFAPSSCYSARGGGCRGPATSRLQ